MFVTHEMKPKIRAYDLDTFSKAFSLGKTTIYQEIKSGKLKTLKVGRRTLITDEAANAWLKLLESEGRKQ